MERIQSILTLGHHLREPLGLIANQEALAAEGFAGTISDVAFYSTSLTATQVINHYQTGIWFQYQEFGAAEGGAIAGRLNKVLELVGINPDILNVPYPFKTMLYAETEALTLTSALNYLQTTTETEPGLIFQGTDGVIEAYSRQYQYLNPTSITSQGVFGDSASATYHYDGPSFQLVGDDLDLWNDIQVQSGIPESNFALQQEIGILQEWGPAQSPQAALSASIYGQRTLQGLTALQFAYNSDALALAQNYGEWYNFPLQRVTSIQISSRAETGFGLPQMLGRGLYDQITVQYQGQTAGPQFSQNSLIEQIQHNVVYDGGPTWNTQWALSPYEILLTPFIFGNSAQSQLAGAASVTGSTTHWVLHPAATKPI